MFTLRHTLIGISIHLMAASSLFADQLAVTNPSFESRTGYNGGGTSAVPGWVAFGSSTRSAATYGNVVSSTTEFTTGLTGNNSIYLNGGIAQTLSAAFVTGATYRFSVDVGNPSGVINPTSASVAFGFVNTATNNYLANGFASTTQVSAIPDGTFQTFSFTYTATAADNGTAIKIGIEDFFNGDNDKYRLDNVLISSSVVPEPSTYVGGFLTVSSFVAAVARRKRKNRA